MIKCNNCGRENHDVAVFCQGCGTRLKPEPSNETVSSAVSDDSANNSVNNTVICGKCGTENPNGTIFCSSCGTKIAETTDNVYDKTSYEPKSEPTNIRALLSGTETGKRNSNKTIICDICGEENPEGTKNCQSCGNQISKVPASQASAAASYSRYKQQSNDTDSIYRSKFVDGDEHMICTLGNGYLENIVANSFLARNTAILTQKRVYFSGHCYFKDGNRWKSSHESKILDIEDVTGTGFTYISFFFYLVMAYTVILGSIVMGIFWMTGAFGGVKDVGGGLTVMLAGIVLSIPFLIMYIKHRISVFQIDYAGGQIGFEVKMFGQSESINFQRQIHLIKAAKLEKNRSMFKQTNVTNDRGI